MSINELPIVMVRCLVFTIIIEVIVGIILGIRNKKDILNVILVILEVITLFVEGFIYLKVLNYKKLNPFLISLFLNLSSYLIGELINYFL